MELHRLNDSEQIDRRRKWLSLKAHATRSESESSVNVSESDED